uniref:Uncharacterized protein n=1 Tax=Eutreptiella gymnastica TaxID=73025 RepID=A0A7S4FNQ4_9EUGL
MSPFPMWRPVWPVSEYQACGMERPGEENAGSRVDPRPRAVALDGGKEPNGGMPSGEGPFRSERGSMQIAFAVVACLAAVAPALAMMPGGFLCAQASVREST